jgi:nickel-dependent lactate racemase
VKDIIKVSEGRNGISDEELSVILDDMLKNVEKPLKKILLLPPDFTRMHSGAGKITAMLYSKLKDTVTVDIMPALGTHEPISKEQADIFFEGAVPYEEIIHHRWREDVVNIGEVPSSFVSEVSDGLMSESVPIEINKRLLDPSYDLILSIGQVVPHEVAGMANYTKNVLVGCGGKSTIDKSHMLGAVFGLERVMGKDHSPVRKVFDYAQEHFLNKLPLAYILTVTTAFQDNVKIEGIYCGKTRKIFEDAVTLSRQKNLNRMDKPIKKAVVYLDPREFKSTWLGNKAIYRTHGTLSTPTRFPVVRLRPAQPSLHAIDIIFNKFTARVVSPLDNSNIAMKVVSSFLKCTTMNNTPRSLYYLFELKISLKGEYLV